MSIVVCKDWMVLQSVHNMQPLLLILTTCTSKQGKPDGH